MRENHPDRVRIILKDRRGFIKVALQTGTDLVPVFSFGENELWDAKIHDLSSKLDLVLKFDQLGLKSYLRLSFWSQFIVELYALLRFSAFVLSRLPKKKPVNVVVGKPISVSQVDEPTQEQIDELHQTYVLALTNLFDEHKDAYLNKKGIRLEII